MPIFTIQLSRPATHLYGPADNVEVNVFADTAGGGLENDIGAQSINVAVGASTISLGRVPAPGVYFTRYRAAGATFAHAFLVLPAAGGRFTVEPLGAPQALINHSPADEAALRRYFSQLNTARLQAAAAAAAPAWFAQNGQNFVVLAAKGVILTYTGGLAFFVVLRQGGIAQEIVALSIDFAVTVMGRAADDLRQAQLLTAAERDTVKRVLSGLNGAAQTLLSDGLFQRVVSLGQGVSSVVLGQDDDSQITAKVTGDFAKKVHVFLGLNPR